MAKTDDEVGGMQFARKTLALMAIALLVAIIVSHPVAAASVVGNTSFVRWYNPASPANNLTIDDGTLFVDSSKNRVGINTQLPLSQFHVQVSAMANQPNAAIDNSSSAGLFIGSDTSLQIVSDDAGGSASGIMFTNVPTAGNNSHWVLSRKPINNGDWIGFVWSDKNGSGQGGNVFGTADAGGVVMSLRPHGSVNIGSSANTSETLKVTGNASVTGNLSVSGRLVVTSGLAASTLEGDLQNGTALSSYVVVGNANFPLAAAGSNIGLLRGSGSGTPPFNEAGVLVLQPRNGHNVTILEGGGAYQIANFTDAGNFYVYRNATIPGELWVQGRNVTPDSYASSASLASVLNKTAGWSGLWRSRDVYATSVGVVRKQYAFNDSALLAWWDLGDSSANETASGVSMDLSGSGRTLTLGNATVGATPFLNTTLGVVGNSLYFNRTQVASFANITNSEPQPAFTLAAWFNPASGQGASIVEVNASVGGAWSRAGLLFIAPNRVWAIAANATTNYYVELKVAANTWAHGVFAYDNGAITLCVDGVCANNVSTTGSAVLSSRNAVGGAGNSGFFNGSIDDVKIWNRTISNAEAQALYNAGNPSGYGGQEANASTAYNPVSLSVTGNVSVDAGTLFVNSNTNRVGVGTDIPQTALDVYNSKLYVHTTDTIPGGTAGFIDAWENGQSTPVMRLTATDSSAFAYNVLMLQATRAANSGYNFINATAGAGGSQVPIMVLRGDGKLGLGAAVPGVTLHVNSSTDTGVAVSSGANYTYLGMVTATGSYSDLSKPGDSVLRADQGSLILTARNALGNITFGTGASDSAKMTLASGGNVGIGTTTPVSKLDVAGTIRSTAQTVPTSGAGVETIFNANTGYIAAYNRTNSTYRPLNIYGNVLTFNPGAEGKVGVAIAAPTHTLQLGDDDAAKTTTTTWTTTSDAKAKKDFSDYANVLSKLDCLGPMQQYKYNGRFGIAAGTPGWGWTAQKLLACGWTEAVYNSTFYNATTNSTEGFMQANYDVVFKAAIEAARELNENQTRLAVTQAKLAEKIDAQQKQLDSLKQIVCADHPNTELCKT